jgi:hypothetical protein
MGGTYFDSNYAAIKAGMEVGADGSQAFGQYDICTAM